MRYTRPSQRYWSTQIKLNELYLKKIQKSEVTRT